MEPIATWNPARGAWETAETSLFCEHAALYSPTWPTSGSMRNGCLYPPLKSGRLIGASGSSSSPGLLRTPTAQLAVNGGSQHPEKRKAGGHGPTLADEIEHLLPTPSAQNSHGNANRGGARAGELLLPGVVQALLPTPSVALATGGQSSRSGDRIDEMLLTGIARAAACGTLLPTPAAHDSANTPENHLRKKPGRTQVTSLQVIVDYGLLPSGGRMPSPSAGGNVPPAGQLPGQLSLDELGSD